jgi:deazaflavin-dependent oxidoreductase (nitroreductase family)
MASTTTRPELSIDSTPRAFPLAGTNLYRLISDHGFKDQFHARLKRGNRFIAPLYKLGILPLFGLSKQIMLLTTRGRKSGAMRDTPIGYFWIDGTVHVFSAWARGANWYKNLVACPEEVWVQIGTRRFRARPEVVEDPLEVKRAVEQLIVQDPRGARMLMGWDPKRDRVETANLSLMIEKVLVVRFHPR